MSHRIKTARGDYIDPDILIMKAKTESLGDSVELQDRPIPTGSNQPRVRGFIPTPRSMADVTGVVVGKKNAIDDELEEELPKEETTSSRKKKKAAEKEVNQDDERVEGIDELLNDLKE